MIYLSCPKHSKHKNYHISCDQFVCLAERSKGVCEICGQPPRGMGLYIDHDHTLGWLAVRGLLCSGCNTRVHYIEVGRRRLDQLTANYLEHPWYAEAAIVDFSCPESCAYGHHRRISTTPRPDNVISEEG